MDATITKEYKFEAAHLLPNHTGKCAHLHGHSYRVQVSLTGGVQPEACQSEEGMVVDFAWLDKVVDPLVAQLDHHFIAKGDEWPCNASRLHNTDDVFYLGHRTTAENIATWFAHWIFKAVEQEEYYVSVTVYETAKSSARVIVP